MERVASGPGLVNLQLAVAEIRGAAVERLSPEEVSARGAAGADTICSEAIRRFAGALGSAAGDLA